MSNGEHTNIEETRAQRVQRRDDARQVNRELRNAFAVVAATGLIVGGTLAGRLTPSSTSPSSPNNSTISSDVSGLLQKLSEEDREIITWYIRQVRHSDKEGKFNYLTDKNFIEGFMHDKELNVKTRNLYDFAMLLDAQQKSGYNIFEVTDKPLPLKWEALTPLQQRAVDHAIEKELDAPVAGMDLNELDKQRITRLENPANLQPMIDAYRNAPKRSRAGQPSAGIGNYRS